MPKTQRRIIDSGDVQGIHKYLETDFLFKLRLDRDTYVKITADNILDMLDLLDVVIEHTESDVGVPRVVTNWTVSHITIPRCVDCETADI